MKIAVLGGGNGALAVACEWGLAGHEVAMAEVESHSRGLVPVAEAGSIRGTGKIEGVAPIRIATTDFAAALEGAELVFVVGPAFATEPLAAAAGPHLRPGMTVVVNPGSCLGAVAFARAAGLELDQTAITVAELSTLPYATRVTGPAEVHVFHKLTGALFVAALGQERTQEVRDLLAQVWPETEAASSVWQTALQNGNPVIHPAVSLLNAGPIDRGGDFLFYEDGVTDGVGRLIEAVDAERLAIAEALGVAILSEPQVGMVQGYMLEDNYSTSYSTAPGFLGIGAQNKLDHRYLTEDVGYGLVFLTDLARRLGVPTPVMDAEITIADTILGRDFRAESARTLDTLGLGDLGPEELRAL